MKKGDMLEARVSSEILQQKFSSRNRHPLNPSLNPFLNPILHPCSNSSLNSSSNQSLNSSSNLYSNPSFNQTFESQIVPALISSLVLRSQNLGQVDIVYLKSTKAGKRKWTIHIIETKFSLYPAKSQLRRLRRTQDYLSRILELEAKLEVKFCQKDDHSLSF